MQADGRVLQTYLRGQLVFDSQAADLFQGEAKGKLLL